MLKLFEIEDETPPDVSERILDQNSGDIDKVTLPSGISVNLPVSWCVSNQSDSVRAFGLDNSVREPCWGSRLSYSEASPSRQSFGLQNISDSPPRRSLVREDFESNEFIVTSEEICF